MRVRKNLPDPQNAPGPSSLLKKSAAPTQGAEAPVKAEGFIAAVNRCATQKQTFSAKL
jgi:hypothetical protein